MGICCVNKLLGAATSRSGCGLIHVWSVLTQKKKTLCRLCFHFFFFKQSPFYVLCKVYTFEMFEDRRPGMTGIPKPCIRRGSSIWVVTRCGFPPLRTLPPPPPTQKNVGGCIRKDMRGNRSRSDCAPLQLIWPIRWRRRCAL